MMDVLDDGWVMDGGTIIMWTQCTHYAKMMMKTSCKVDVNLLYRCCEHYYVKMVNTLCKDDGRVSSGGLRDGRWTVEVMHAGRWVMWMDGG